jgi:hypothetical protein
MSNWQEGAYEKLEPLLLLLRQTVKAGIFMAMDENPRPGYEGGRESGHDRIVYVAYQRGTARQAGGYF